MKTPAQLTEILEALVDSGKAKISTVMTSMAEINHQLVFPGVNTVYVAPKFEVPLAGADASAALFVDHLLKDKNAQVRRDSILQQAETGESELLFLKEVQGTSKAFQNAPVGELAQSGSNVIEVFYHTRDLIEFHPNLYAQATISPNDAIIKQLTDKGLFERAAVVIFPEGAEATNLEAAFETTQNIEDSWTDHKHVIAITDRPRSSMVGDVMVKDGKPFVVAMMGFKPLESFEPFPEPEAKKETVRAMDSDGLLY